MLEIGLPAAFTHAQATAAGISDRDLARLTARGELERIARGIYARPDHGADPDLLELALRNPATTLCLATALAHHDLTDEVPSTIHAALPRDQWQPKTAAPFTWHRFDPATFDLGRDNRPVLPGISIGIYSPARSIVDAYRLSHLQGIDLAHHALRRWITQPGNQPSQLLELAQSFPRTATSIRTVLEILL
ncbi:MAG: type IV toxin-antitoxin system AbiEi family antitoxin domain-containing protein [Acidimicrobiales bacterium]